MTTRMTAAQYRALPKKRRHKYGAKRTTLDGITFDSKGEALRWKELKTLERARKICGLCRQLGFPLHAGGVHLGDYVCDFAYVEAGRSVIEDYKGYDDVHARWKRKHAEAEYGIKILLTGPAAKPRRKRGRAA